MALQAFTDLRLGKQTSAGTPVAATVILDGVTGYGKDDRKIEKPGPKYSNGRLTPRANSYTGVYGGSVEMDGDATFDGILYDLDAGVHTVGIPTGSGASKTWTASFPPLQANVYAVNPYTIEADAQLTAAKQLEYAFVKSIELSGKPDGSLAKKVVWIAANYQPMSAKTGSLTYVNYEVIVFNAMSVFIDDIGGTIGTTDFSQNVVDFNLKIDTGLVLESGPGGTSKLTKNRLRRGRPVVKLDMTLDTEAGLYLTEETKKNALAYRQIRLSLPGSLITAGTPNIYHLLQIDLGGKWDMFDKLSTRVANEGAMSVKGQFTAGEDETGTVPNLFCNFTVINTLATLT